ncbi:MAG: xanthine dehydrogenase molybdopterin binding subunit, partial [Actinomycetota bacterium]
MSEPGRRVNSVVGEPVSDESATLHVTGRATYVDDIPAPEDVAHGVLALSTIAHGQITSLDVSRAARQPGVLAVLTAADIPGVNSHAPRSGVDPILAGDEVSYAGQPIAMVVATTRRAAQKAAALVRVEYTAGAAVLDPRAAHAHGSYVFDPLHLARPSVEATDEALGSAPNRLQG